MSAQGVCVRARLLHLPFWTGKAASAAEERSSNRGLWRGREREREGNRLIKMMTGKERRQQGNVTWGG